MRCKLRILVGVLALFSVPVSAREPGDSAKDAEVRRLIEVMGVKKMMDNVFPQMMAQMRAQMDQTLESQLKGLNLPEGSLEQSKKIREFMFERMTEEFKTIDMEGMSARIYSKHFTTEEVRALIQFYESPVGRKMLEKTPAILQESMTETYALTSKLIAALLKETREKFPEIFAPPPPQP